MSEIETNPCPCGKSGLSGFIECKDKECQHPLNKPFPLQAGDRVPGGTHHFIVGRSGYELLSKYFAKLK